MSRAQSIYVGLSCWLPTFGGGTRMRVTRVFLHPSTGTPMVSVRFSAPHLKARAMSAASFLEIRKFNTTAPAAQPENTTRESK